MLFRHLIQLKKREEACLLHWGRPGCSSHGTGRSRRDTSAVTIIEVLVSALLIFIGLGAVFGMNTQSLLILRKTRQYSTSCQVLQERVELLRSRPWPEISRAQALATLLQAPAASAGDLADTDPTEGILVTTPAPPGGRTAPMRSFEIRRRDGVATVVSDDDLSTESLLQFEVSLVWRGADRIYQRKIRTIIFQNGLTRAGLFGSVLGRPQYPAPPPGP